VRLGLRSTALSEVLDGLSEGDQVLAADAADGQRVRLTLQPLPAGVAE
jgi:HlyD family secretion protein